jgi:hypothetical protein
MQVRARLLAALAVALAVVPAAARADTFTVAAGDATSLQSALTQAAAHPNGSGPDVVAIPAGTYTGNFTYQGDAVDVEGAGQATTTLTTAAGGSTTFLIKAPDSAVGGLNVANTATTYGMGLDLVSGGTVRDVQITATGNAITGMRGAATTDVARVVIEVGPNDTGVRTSGSASMTISQATLQGAGGGSNGILADSPGAHADVARVRSVGVPFPLGATFGGAMTVRDSLLILPTGVNTTALVASDNGNTFSAFTSTLDAERVTIVGDLGPNQTGAAAYADSAGDDFKVSLHDSLIFGVAKPLRCGASAGAGHVSADWSNLPDTGDVSTGAVCTTARTNAIPGAPIFVDAANGDYHQRSGSPLIDAGDPASLAPTVDLDGLPRPVGRVDVGAYEFQPAPAAGTDPSAQPADSAVTQLGSAPGRTAPIVTLLVKPRLSLTRALRRGIRATVGCSAACRYKATLRLGARRAIIGTLKTNLAAAGTRTLTIRLTHRGRTALRRLERARLLVQASATDGAGNTGRAQPRRISLQRQ